MFLIIMSTYFKESNNETTIKLYNKSIIYKDRAIRSEDNNIVDFNRGEKTFFGRIRRDSTPVIVTSQRSLKKIKNSPPGEPPQRAMNFVVDVFHEMTTQFKKCAELGKIDGDEPFLGNLVAHQSYQDPRRLYIEYKNSLFGHIASYFRVNNVYVEDFPSFVHKFLSMARGITQTTRITFPGFVKSRDCPILVSGLAIEIAADQDCANDDEKVKQFINSKNWDFYVNTCDTYGFMIDYNIPWRIVADIDSEIMREYAGLYGYVSPQDLLERAYTSVAANYSHNTLVDDLFVLYNHVRVPYWSQTITCRDGSTKQISKFSKTYTREQLLTTMTESDFFQIFLQLRLYEERPDLNDSEIQQLVKDVGGMVSSGKKAYGLKIFERIINKEFDKIGSFSYIRYSDKKKLEQSFSEGEVDAIKVDADDISSY